jgi:hypothetical protein
MARHSRGTAWARHAMCESAFTVTLDGSALTCCFQYPSAEIIAFLQPTSPIVPCSASTQNTSVPFTVTWSLFSRWKLIHRSTFVCKPITYPSRGLSFDFAVVLTVWLYHPLSHRLFLTSDLQLFLHYFMRVLGTRLLALGAGLKAMWWEGNCCGYITKLFPFISIMSTASATVHIQVGRFHPFIGHEGP